MGFSPLVGGPVAEGGVSVLDLLFNYGPAAADLLREGITGWRNALLQTRRELTHKL